MLWHLPHSSNPQFLHKIILKSKPPTTSIHHSGFTIISYNHQRLTSTTPNQSQRILYAVHFKSLSSCKLGISRYPDFAYDALGGSGSGIATKTDDDSDARVSVEFDAQSLDIPSLSSATTKFLGLPMPSFLKIDIVPEAFHGIIDRESGKVELNFTAEFWFSAGSVYKAPPLLVKTVLTTEESKGKMRGGKGKRLDENGSCRLVGVATVEPIKDVFMDTFLSLPTECLADLNAVISFAEI